MISLLILLVCLLAVSAYSVLLLAVCAPIAFRNGRAVGRRESELVRGSKW